MVAQKVQHGNGDYKQVIVTREDLPLSMGKLAVQVAHAAVACTLLTKQRKSDWCVKWQQEGAKKVVVSVGTLEEFIPLKEKAESLGLVALIISDAGHTEIPEGTQTVLGIGPAPCNLIDQVTGQLPLL
ncbi:MAG: peptidyl-tRNA hydrolase [Candidatus Thermoplasmatota archaeon]|nr:peptidyl-tRNA hydrolase [Candidatus Thermoplasmatota archaeon]